MSTENLSEAGHWYNTDGEPRYTQTVLSGKRKGEQRPTTLRDAKKQFLVPSVTTILGVLDKPALNIWKMKRAVASAKGEAVEENNAAEIGTAIHACIEHWIETGEKVGKYARWCDTVEKIFKEVGVEEPDSERSFAHVRCFPTPVAFAGAVDLSDSTKQIIIDFKTKDFSNVGGILIDKSGKQVKHMHYDEHGMQLAAYATGLQFYKPTLYNLFLSRQDPEAYLLHEWDKEEAQRCGDMFESLSNYFLKVKKLPYNELLRRYGVSYEE